MESALADAKVSNTKKAQFSATRRMLEKRSADLRQQIALLQEDIASFKNELAANGLPDYLPDVHVCACAPLCSAIWSKLPEVSLNHVFACLSLPGTFRLRVLSKTWNSKVTGVPSGFTEACAERHPKMFALVSVEITYTGRCERVIVKPFLRQEAKWHTFVREAAVLKDCDSMIAGDGGLVCIVSTDQEKRRLPLRIVVFNPLTGQPRELPFSIALRSVEPCLVQLVMDRDSKSYNVFVVGFQTRRGGDKVARVYSSVTGEWSNPNTLPDLIFGCQYKWNPPLRNKFNRNMAGKAGPCAYECTSNTLLEYLQLDPDFLLELGVQNLLEIIPVDLDPESYVFVKDHLFVLVPSEDTAFTYFLRDYKAGGWPLRLALPNTHDCPELNGFARRRGIGVVKIVLYGGQDFLVAVACSHDSVHSMTVLFDLSTNEWQIIPKIPNWDASTPGDMFQLRWDAVP